VLMEVELSARAARSSGATVSDGCSFLIISREGKMY
jgi:hypothetical protein